MNDSLDATPSTPTAATLPKWPFILGDALLVAVALGIWATHPDLSALQTGFCLAAVAVGGGFFCLPFALEFFTRAQLLRLELEQARAEDFQRLAALDGEMRKQARLAFEAVEQATRATAALESSSRRFDARLAPLEEIHRSLAETATPLREAAALLKETDKQSQQRELERLRQSQAEKLLAGVESLGPVVARLEALLAQPAAKPSPASDGTAAALAGLREQMDFLLQAVAGVTTSPPVEAAPPKASPVETAADSARAEPPAVVVDKSELTEGSMLSKALGTAQSAEDSPAVNRIIQSRPRRPKKPKLEADTAPTTDAATPTEVPPAPVEIESPVEVAAVAEPAPSPETPPAPQPLSNDAWDAFASGTFDTVTATSDNPDAAAPAEPEAPAVPHAEFPEITESPFVPATVSAKIAALRAEEDEPAATPAQVELLTAPPETAPETSRRRRTAKPAADAATLVARVLIGIGNKPYVRGDGPGLSPDKGVPMEFVEIGQWRWIAPESSASPMTLRILKNDEVPARGDPIVLEPGKTLEVVPEFPN